MLAGSFFVLDLDLDLAFLKRTWTRTWTCPLNVDLDLDLDLTVAGLVTSLPTSIHISNAMFTRSLLAACYWPPA